MRITKTLHGVIPPLMTPLNKEGHIDIQGTRNVIDRCINGGVTGLFILGTMGEGQTITDADKEIFIKEAYEYTAGRVPVLVGVSAESYCRVMENVKRAERCGADYLVVLPPYFSGASCQADLVNFFTNVADNASKPVLIYNNPIMTKNALTFDSFKTLAAHKNIVGVKNSSSDFDFHMKLVREFKEREDFAVFTGVETMCDNAILTGTDGLVPGLGTLCPEIFVECYKAGVAMDVDKANEIQNTIIDMFDDIYLTGYWAWQVGQKYALSVLGVCEKYHSAVTRELSDADKAKIEAALEKYNIK